jgi:dolichol-phosphate mannosyltransferase
LLGKQVSLHMSAALGIELSILSNYVLNNWITFSDQRHRGAEALRGLAVFQLISMVGLMVQLSVFEFLYTGAPLPESIAPTIGKYFYYGVAIVVAMITNYSLNLNFTWRKKA